METVKNNLDFLLVVLSKVKQFVYVGSRILYEIPSCFSQYVCVYA